MASGSDGIPSCTLSKSVAINFLREAITAKQLRIEIWSQPSSSKNSSTWELDRQASPGNFEEVEDLLFDNSNQNITESPMCIAICFRIKDGIKNVGIAYIDSVERRLGVTEFVDTDIFSNTEVSCPSTFFILRAFSASLSASSPSLPLHIILLLCRASRNQADFVSLCTRESLQSLLIQLGVKEVLIPAEEKTADPEAQKLRKLIERCGIVVTERKRSACRVFPAYEGHSAAVAPSHSLT